MKILQKTYDQIIFESRKIPYETGGILGGANGVITISQFDDGLPSTRMCSYIPNTRKLNLTIKKWQQSNITFMGIYHTHFWNVETLSVNDEAYINKIMYCMPGVIEQLYFPLVVMPNPKLVSYTAKKVSGELVEIKRDKINIIGKAKEE